MANLYHQKDLDIFRNKGLEYYTFVLTSWMIERNLNKEPVTEDELFSFVRMAESKGQSCFVQLYGHHVSIPVDYLRDAANASSLVMEDLLWRHSTLKPEQYCANGYDYNGFSKEGRSILIPIVVFTQKQKEIRLEEVKSQLESLYRISK